MTGLLGLLVLTVLLIGGGMALFSYFRDNGSLLLTRRDNKRLRSYIGRAHSIVLDIAADPEVPSTQRAKALALSEEIRQHIYKD